MQQKQAMRSLSVYKAMLNERGDPTARVSVNDVGNYTLAEQFARFLEKNVNQILETKTPRSISSLSHAKSWMIRCL